MEFFEVIKQFNAMCGKGDCKSCSFYSGESGCVAGDSLAFADPKYFEDCIVD